MTATRRRFIEADVRRWLATRRDHPDRADWAVVRHADGAVIGETVLNELDPDNASVNFRIALGGPPVFGRGYRTEATGLALDHAFAMGRAPGSASGHDVNRRARRV